MSRTRIALASLAVAGLVTACASADESTSTAESIATTAAPTAGTTAGTAGGAASESTAPEASAPAALQFSAASVGGDEIDFTQFAGQPVVLWFWAPT